MTTTSNLQIALIDVNQAQASVTANEAFSALDSALSEWSAIEVEDGTNTLGSGDVLRNQLLLLTAGSPGPSAAFDVVLPAIKRLLVIRNEAGETATVACAGAATGALECTLGDGEHAIVYCDSTQVYRLTPDGASLGLAFTGLSDVPSSYAGSGGYAVEVNGGETGLQLSAKPYDVGAFVPGVPTASQVVLRFVAVREFSLPSGLTGSQVSAAAAATASADFDIRKNGVSIGTATFAASGTSATFTFSSAATFSAGDVLSVVAPGTPDATLSDVTFVFAGTRS